jgi:hypothetical protein
MNEEQRSSLEETSVAGAKKRMNTQKTEAGNGDVSAPAGGEV